MIYGFNYLEVLIHYCEPRQLIMDPQNEKGYYSFNFATGMRKSLVKIGPINIPSGRIKGRT